MTPPKLAYHMGHCCAIKTIYNLGSSPYAETWPEPKREVPLDDISCDRNGYTMDEFGEYTTLDNMYYGGHQSQERIKSFDEILHYLADFRPFGLVEVAIVVDINRVSTIMDSQNLDLENHTDNGDTDGWSSFEQSEWVPELEKRGFKKVSEVPNSNSGNIVQVYHLVMNKDWHINVRNQVLTKKDK